MKLKSSQVKAVRENLLKQQNFTCALCKLELAPEKAVLDHDHSTGAIRAVLHRGCNSLLGKVENNYKRYGVDLISFSSNLGSYISTHTEDQTGLLHPTHRSPEEKRLLRAKRAKRVKLNRKLVLN